jgi:hypothetical protein
MLKHWPGAEFVEGLTIARNSAVGSKMSSTSGSATKMVRAQAEAGINIKSIATSKIRMRSIVAKKAKTSAQQAFCKTFFLNGESQQNKPKWTEHPPEGVCRVPIVKMLNISKNFSNLQGGGIGTATASKII